MTASAFISARVSTLTKAPPPVASTTPWSLSTPGDDAGFAGTEFGFAALLENLGNGHLRGLLDFLVAIEKMPVEAGGEAAADRGLARAHHADQHQRLAGKALGKLLGAGLP